MTSQEFAHLSNGGFGGSSGHIGSYNVKYVPSKFLEGGLTSGVLTHILGMETCLTKSTEEMRWEDYQHRSARQPVALGMMANQAGNTMKSAPGSALLPTSALFSQGSSTGPGLSTTAAGPSTSLFSSQPLTQATSNPVSWSGMGSTAPASTGISGPSPNTQTGGTLFGSQTQGGTSLFGGNLGSGFVEHNGGGVGVEAATGVVTFGAGSASATQQQPGSSLFNASSPSLFAPAAQSSSSLGFGSSSTNPGLFGQGNPSLLGSTSVYGQQTGQVSMISPTSLFSPQQLQPPAPVTDSAHLLQAYKDPGGIFGYLFKDGVPQELTKPHESLSKLASKKRKTGSKTGSFAVPLETWKPSFLMRRSNAQKTEQCDLLDLTTSQTTKAVVSHTKRFNGYQSDRSSFHSWLSTERSLSSVEDTELIEIRVKGIPENPLRMSSQSSVEQLVSKVCEILGSPDSEEVRLWYRGGLLDRDKKLWEAEVTDGAEVYYIIEPQPSGKEKEIAPAEYIPRLSRSGYTTVPSMVDLARMSITELRTVEHFTISNSYGSIEFPGRTDLVKLDLDAIVHIRKKAVVLYPEKYLKPKLGKGLNRPAKITIFACFAKKKTDENQFEDQLRETCVRNKTHFQSYDLHSGTWVFTTDSA